MKLLFWLLLISMLEAKNVYIVPIGGLDPNVCFYNPYVYRDEVAKPLVCFRESLEKMGYKVLFTKDGDNLKNVAAVFSFNDIHPKLLWNLSKIPRQKCHLLVFEPPVVMPDLYNRDICKVYGKIFLMLDDYVDGKQYFKLHYPQPRLEIVGTIPHFSEKKLAAFIGGNKSSSHPQELYSERRAFISFFTTFHPAEFDLYGPGWDGYSSSIIPNKWEVIRNYKFCFAYENMKDQRGYITEKIFDVMVGGAVPIYYGATNIEDYIPKTCFIDRRDFSSLEDLYNHLSTMEEATYNSYLNSIRDYLASDKAHLFSIDHFTSTLCNF